MGVCAAGQVCNAPVKPGSGPELLAAAGPEAVDSRRRFCGVGCLQGSQEWLVLR
jgi:hypothetical protein